MPSRWFVAIAVIVAGVIVIGLSVRRGPVTAHISGDLATDLAETLHQAAPDVVFVSHPTDARIAVIAVNDWEKLAFVPGALLACGDDCRPSIGNTIVRIVRVTPFGVRKHVFVNIRPFLSDVEPDRFVLSPEGRTCLGLILALETSAIRPDSWSSGCVPESGVVFLLKLGVS